MLAYVAGIALIGMLVITWSMLRDAVKIKWYVPEKSRLEKIVEERQLVKRAHRDL